MTDDHNPTRPMKLWHPEDRLYIFTRCRWEPMPPYRSSAWLGRILPKQDSFDSG